MGATAVQGRCADELVFDHLPKNMDVQSYRRTFAQALYLTYVPERTLPPDCTRLRPSEYDANATCKVSEASGHHRVSIVLNHYLR